MEMWLYSNDCKRLAGSLLLLVGRQHQLDAGANVNCMARPPYCWPVRMGIGPALHGLLLDRGDKLAVYSLFTACCWGGQAACIPWRTAPM